MPYTRRRRHKNTRHKSTRHNSTRHKSTRHKSTRHKSTRTKGGASARILTPIVPLLSALLNANTDEDQADTMYQLMTSITLLETSGNPPLTPEDAADIKDIKTASLVLRTYGERRFNAEKYKILTPVLLRLLKQCGTQDRRYDKAPFPLPYAQPSSAQPPPLPPKTYTTLLPPQASSRSQQPLAHSQEHPYTIKEAGGAGDCLYYSIYETLKEANLLQKLQTQIQFRTKDQFVAAMRLLQGIEARNHTESIDGAVSSMYDYMEWYDPNRSSVSEYFFKEMDIQPWLSETFIALVENFEIYDYNSYLRNPDAREAMYQAVIEDISTPGTYAQSYEVGLMNAILKRSGITMIITYPNALHRTVKIPPPANTIYIVNMSSQDARQDQNHFKYVSFISR